MPTTQQEAASIIRIFTEEGVPPARVARIAARLTAEVGEPSENDSVKQTMRMLAGIAACVSADAAGEVKPWGESIPLYRDAACEIVRVKIRRGGFSSRHYHEHKHNLFIVLSGTLEVKEYNGIGETLKTSCLRKETAALSVPAGMPHRFYALKDVDALEVYVARDAARPVEPGDIVRLDEGGRVDVDSYARERVKAQ